MTSTAAPDVSWPASRRSSSSESCKRLVETADPGNVPGRPPEIAAATGYPDDDDRAEATILPSRPSSDRTSWGRRLSSPRSTGFSPRAGRSPRVAGDPPGSARRRAAFHQASHHRMDRTVHLPLRPAGHLRHQLARRTRRGTSHPPSAFAAYDNGPIRTHGVGSPRGPERDADTAGGTPCAARQATRCGPARALRPFVTRPPPGCVGATPVVAAT